MNLPDINEMYPQNEPDLFQKCIHCGTEIFVGEEYVTAAGYAYCDKICFADLALEEGTIERRIAENNY